MDCSEIVPNRHFITVLNKCVLIKIFELLLFLAIETRVAAVKSFHAIGPATTNPRFCIDDNRQRLTTGQQTVSADALAPLKPAHRVPADTTVLFGWCSSQPVAGSWILISVQLEASADCLWSTPILVRTSEFEAAFKILWTRSVCTAVMLDRTELQ